VLPKVAKGQALGGTGMSNPMKAMGEIERMRLKGERVEGGYKVKGVLPWVSNLIDDGYFGTIFDVEVEGEDKPKRVMAIIHAAWEGISLRLDHEFVAMGGTATCNVQFRDVFVPDEYLLSDPAEPFVKRIRAGFTLLQCGMAAGIIKNCIDLMKQVQGPLGHVNKYLEKQPEDIEAEYDALVADVLELAKTPYDTSDVYNACRRAFKGGELSVEVLALRRARLRHPGSGAAPPARSLFRGDRDAGDQASAQDDRRARRGLTEFHQATEKEHCHDRLHLDNPAGTRKPRRKRALRPDRHPRRRELCRRPLAGRGEHARHLHLSCHVVCGRHA
jgi:hypothetical protein